MRLQMVGLQALVAVLVTTTGKVQALAAVLVTTVCLLVHENLPPDPYPVFCGALSPKRVVPVDPTSC